MSVSLKEVEDFSSGVVFTSLENRYRAGSFSRGLWKSMGGMGLLGLTVSERYGGSGGTPVELAEAVREFTRKGCDLGLALSWITHLALCVKSIEFLGTEDQKERYLPKLVAGEWVGATAVSEPGSGSHPRGIKTFAEEIDGGFRLSGEKVYITDGPEADLLVVLAATDGGVEEKELTAFLVESSLSGFRAEPMELDFVRTSPQGRIVLEGVELGADAVLGRRGRGHSEFSRAAFARERSVVCAALCGLFAAASNEVAARYRQKYEGFDFTGKDTGSWIHHLSAIEAYRHISNEITEAAFNDLERWRRSIDLLIYMGLSYGKWGFWICEFARENELEITFPLDIILNDSKLALVGESLLLKEGRKRFMR